MAAVTAINRLKLNLNAKEIASTTDELIERMKAVYDSVGLMKNADVTYENCIKTLADFSADSSAIRSSIDFPQHVSPDKEIRNASTEAERKLSEVEVEISMRQDVYDNIKAFDEKLGQTLTGEVKRFVSRLIRNGKRNGLHLDKEIRDQITVIKKRMTELAINFNRNLNEENTILEFSTEDLHGLPDDFLDGLSKTESGLYQVSLKYPHYFPCMKKATNPETRRKLETAFNSRCKDENAAIMEELVELRQKQADLLGYAVHADYITEIRMSKTAANVKNFLSRLASKLKPLGESDLQAYLKYKSEESQKYGYKDDAKIHAWDMRYYMNLVEEKEYSVDHEKLKEYFPLEIVTEGLLNIYQQLLDLKFEEVENAEVWHPEVRLFNVSDGSSGTFMGQFYLDLHPREGKFGHAACFGLQPGCVLSDGSRQHAIAAMVANFTKPTATRPALLIHDEVVTYFHEFGHVMHGICAEANFSMFSGTRVERDFVEAPSQMLENWCWEKESLCKMSAHYKDSSPIPDDLLEKLIKSQRANAGVFNLRQIMLGTFDQTIHTSRKADTAAVYARLSEEILGIQATPGTNMAATFGHLADGYDAMYYGYLWSEVYCMDMFYTRFKKNVMNATAGRDYREKILKPGGTKDAIDMLKEFLGRDPDETAFLTSKGLTVD
ncbi:uncharacterized protein TRIADDRAFT_22587 [Trichoplax adhaerens]|uniref:Peptidase M3A/M3B catalytic domain-containing protein n=1 Tax=Trichoplax adhaerens TaxID=10228 RepID=B3RQH1_TRIAD|nr:hypothetical protein TRIADDRAFT_22587 [Trichoplax adhaerens]EDV27240.1 hypothetical protein TRIADDRAFT_22587 [Trichoplax adhaerens]|eukprot:XP_002111236.1 hypothetical protein TRIADDRAFT_22587 [Trichoplax adhaerens]